MSTLLTCVASAAARAAAGIEGRHGVPGCLTAALPSNHIKAAADRFAARLGRRVVSGQTAAFVCRRRLSSDGNLISKLAAELGGCVIRVCIEV